MHIQIEEKYPKWQLPGQECNHCLGTDSTEKKNNKKRLEIMRQAAQASAWIPISQGGTQVICM